MSGQNADLVRLDGDELANLRSQPDCSLTAYDVALVIDDLLLTRAERDRWQKEAEGRKAFTSRLSRLARRSESRAAKRLNVSREIRLQAAEEHMRRLSAEELVK